MITINTQQGQAGAIAVADEQQPEKIVRIGYYLEELIAWTKALACAVAVREITDPLYVEIDLASNHGLRVCFSASDLPLGYAVVRLVGNGSIEIEVDTVLQDLENRSQGRFELDRFELAAAWIKSLGITLANLEKFWGWDQIIDAAAARLKRLG